MTLLSNHGQIAWVQKVLVGIMIIRIFPLNKLHSQIKTHQHSMGCDNRVPLRVQHVVQVLEPSKIDVVFILCVFKGASWKHTPFHTLHT